MFMSGSGEGVLGSGVDERKLPPSSLTVESRPQQYARLDNPARRL